MFIGAETFPVGGVAVGAVHAEAYERPRDSTTARVTTLRVEKIYFVMNISISPLEVSARIILWITKAPRPKVAGLLLLLLRALGLATGDDEIV